MIIVKNLARVTYKVERPGHAEPYHISTLRSKRRGNRPLVMVGGLCQGTFPYAAHAEVLSEDFDVTVVSLPGVDIGGTPPTTLEEMADALQRLIATLGFVDREFEIAGHSFGGMIALYQNLCPLRPERTTVAQGFLKNPWNAEGMIRHVASDAGGYEFSMMGFSNKYRCLVQKGSALRNWRRMKKLGVANDLVDIACSFEYAQHPIDARARVIISKHDELFNPFANVAGLSPLEDLAIGLPNAEVVMLEDPAYRHSWLQYIEPRIVAAALRGRNPAEFCPVSYKVPLSHQAAQAATVIGLFALAAWQYARKDSPLANARPLSNP